ncbi:hypothetical protein POM88_013613 [Heracleum sosnowskyi]|uniref:Inactive STAND domain-containing protein n=1 Tax=Heracleum sosnowskyi TaxID=360622 RepID=A0AAD8J266_9APIA|nr:hypothetical protein POM88_013613 [Heracleum sosnowskyi]
MSHVHNRGEKKRITLNYLKQPIADDGKLLSEFSNFLGITVRQFVSLTCSSWHQVPKKGLLLEYVKDKYIIPEDAVPWRLEKLEKLKNLEKTPVDGDVDADCEEELVKVYDTDVYIMTRKRKDGREYKLPQEVLKTIKDKIADIEKVLQNECAEATNKLVHGGKEHGPSYLIRRLIQKKEPKSKSKSSASPCTSSVPDQLVSDLTTKIRAQLQNEMDEKLEQKVREMMKMLADKNPDLKLNIEDSEKSVQVSDGDDSVTLSMTH